MKGEELVKERGQLVRAYLGTRCPVLLRHGTAASLSAAQESFQCFILACPQQQWQRPPLRCSHQQPLGRFYLPSSPPGLPPTPTGIIGSGHSYAARRLNSQHTVAGWMSEQMGGLSYLEYIRGLVKRVESDWDGVKADLEAIRKALLDR